MMHVCTHACTHTCISHTHTHTCTERHVHTHTHTHMHRETCTHTHTHMHKETCTHVLHTGTHTLCFKRTGWEGGGGDKDGRPCCLAIREELSLRLAKLNAEPHRGEAEANAPGTFTAIHRTCTTDRSSRATVKFVTFGSPGQQHFHKQQSV